jgi:hypothetical protein
LTGCAARYARSTVADIAGSVRCCARFLLATGRTSIELAESVVSPMQLLRGEQDEKSTSIRIRKYRQIRDFSRATPSFRRAYGDSFSPDRRELLIPSVAQQPGGDHDSAWPHKPKR